MLSAAWTAAGITANAITASTALAGTIRTLIKAPFEVIGSKTARSWAAVNDEFHIETRLGQRSVSILLVAERRGRQIRSHGPYSESLLRLCWLDRFGGRIE